MLLYEIVMVAMGAVRANVLRSVLTTLGIVIGIAAVITMVALDSSRLPVGSSANSTSGRLTKARAKATRCCCPPES